MNSWIQKHVLLILLRNKTAKVSELRPDGVEANLFSYHLEGLVKGGLVTKIARAQYQLTPVGEREVGSLSTASNSKSEYVKTVFMLYARQNTSYLLFRWSRQPYLGKVGFVQDHLPLGRSLDDGLREAMMDKLQSTVTPQFKTSVLIKVEHNGELVSHMNALVYEVNVEGIPLPYTGRNGTAFLGGVEGKEMMVGLAHLFEVIESGNGVEEIILRY